jgi:heptosyltransferase-2
VARAAHLALLEERAGETRRIALEDGGDDARSWRGHHVALLFAGSFRSAWTALRARIPRRVGFARDGRGWLLTDRLRPARERGGTPLGLGCRGRGPRHLPRPLERSLTELLGLVGVPVHDLRPRLAVGERALAAARERRQRLGLATGAPFVLVNVGAREGSAKGYPGELWARVLDELARALDLPLVLACGPGEELALAGVRTNLGGAAAARAFSLIDPPALLPELAAHCADARLVLTSDSGPRHLARAAGAAVVAVAGPTDPRHSAGERARERLLRVVVPCGPCHRERCPLAGTEQKRCMREVAPQAIAAAARELVEAVAPESARLQPGGG